MMRMVTDFSSLPRYGANLRPPPAPALPAARDWPAGDFLLSRLVAGLAFALFLVALGLPAFHEHFTLYWGTDCLAVPVLFPLLLLVYPQWWANPLFLAGLFCILSRKPEGAAAFGVGAVGLALSWWCSWDPSGPGPLLAGYWVWFGAMLTLTVGAAALWFLKRRTPLAA
jgi:hypothetical protein